MFDTTPILFYVFIGIFIVAIIYFLWWNNKVEKEDRFTGEQSFVLILFMVTLLFFLYFITCGVVDSIVCTNGKTYSTSKYEVNDSQKIYTVPGTTNKYIEYTEQDPDVKYAYYFYTKDLNTNELVKNAYSIKSLVIIPVEGITEAKFIKATNSNDYESYYEESKLSTKTYEQFTRNDIHCLILIVPMNSVVNID